MKKFLLGLVLIIGIAGALYLMNYRKTPLDQRETVASSVKQKSVDSASPAMSNAPSPQTSETVAAKRKKEPLVTLVQNTPSPASPSPIAAPSAIPQSGSSADCFPELNLNDAFNIPDNLSKEELIARHNEWPVLQKKVITAFTKKKLAADTVIIKKILALKDLSSEDKLKYSMDLGKSLIQSFGETGDPVILTQAEAFVNDCLNSDNPQIHYGGVNLKSGIFEMRLLPLYRSKILSNLPQGVTEEQALAQMRGPAPKKYTAEEMTAELTAIGRDIIAFLISNPDFVSRLDELIGGMQQIDKIAGEKILVELVNAMRASGKDSLKRAAEKFEGPLRMAQLPGSEMKVEGLFLDGKPINWSDYKGKVVLVDFWATWCGPCLGEIPNMQEQYKKYHDKGFEIIGYSIDDNVEALKNFEKERQLPWKVLSMTTSIQKGMTNLAEYYGIASVPTMILVGRDGKVIRTDARGEILNKELEQLFK